ncbi:MAG: VOC family protein [Thermoanaerobaculia bacterium]
MNSGKRRFAALALAPSFAAALLLAHGCSSSASKSAATVAPNHPGKFVWHTLTSGDLEASKKFYATLLGWQYSETTVLGKKYTVARLGKQPVAGMRGPDSELGKTASHWLPYMSAPDVDATVTKAKASGAKILAGPVDVGTLGRAAVLADPQGAPFGVVRLSAGDPADPAQPIENAFFWNEYLTHDLDAALAFYNGLFPYETTTSKSEENAAYVVLKSDRPRAGVFRLPDSQSQVPPNWLPYVRVSDPAAMAARVAGLGGRVLLEPTPKHRKGSLAIVSDPSGAVVALQKYPF